MSQQNNAVANGNNNNALNLPIMAGQQMDVTFLYQKILELGEVLRENRERARGIIDGAEELATRAAAGGASPYLADSEGSTASAKIAELTQQLHASESRCADLISEQRENTDLIAEWEGQVGKMLKTFRKHTYSNTLALVDQAQQHNKLLQEEKDAHIRARCERDEWHSHFMRALAMIRESYRLRSEEEEVPWKVVESLQEEVRGYRSALGMEPEKSENETGWSILKDRPRMQEQLDADMAAAAAREHENHEK